MRLIHLMIVLLVLASCGVPAPEAIKYGKDQCAFCMMTISDPKFGAELITDKGRIQKYDAAECLVADLAQNMVVYTSLLAVPFDVPNSLKTVDSLHFLISPDFTSPMGANLVAFSTPDQVPSKHSSHLITWDEVNKQLND